jgi:histidinol-phosphatase (PHP family)
MLPEQLYEYASSVKALAERYRGIMSIRLGLEAEYIPLIHESDMELYRSAGVEYLILGQHTVGNESFEKTVDSFAVTTETDAFCSYVDQCIEGLQTGHYSYFAHPDVFHFVGDDSFYSKQCQRLIGAAIDLDIPIELNLLGLCSGRHYPNKLFWQIAGHMGAKTVLGVDAHSPSQVYSQSDIEAAFSYVKENGIRLVDDVMIRAI